MSEPPPVSPPERQTLEVTLRKKLESKARHSKQNKAMLMLTKTEMKKLVEENRKLKEEVAELRSRLERFQPQKESRHPITTKPSKGWIGGGRRISLSRAIPSRRNMPFSPLDCLMFTTTTFWNSRQGSFWRMTVMETQTGHEAIRREGMTVCFPAEDRELVASMVERLAPIYLSAYWGKRRISEN